MSTASESTGADAGWDAFVTQPALYIEPSRLAVCFDGMVDPELCARLKSSLRLEERLSGLVHSRYGLARTIAAEDVSDTDRSIALASSEQLAELCAPRRSDLLGEQHRQYHSGRGCGGVRCRAG